PERRDVVADGSLIVLGREGGPTRHERGGKARGNEKSSTKFHQLLLFFRSIAAFQCGKVKSVRTDQGSQTGECVAVSPKIQANPILTPL
ncbi:hypothetical protein, partial [Rhodococcoides corynebacterioides]|uniref:hypothetical protein n=1 Tax=Rhodococcoides corynebacterioides TaxID=53972 RepID=UPI003AE82F50